MYQFVGFNSLDMTGVQESCSQNRSDNAFPCVTLHNEIEKSYTCVSCEPPRLKFEYRTFERLSCGFGFGPCTLNFVFYLLQEGSLIDPRVWLVGLGGSIL